MAKSRLVGDYPVIGIRPTIDGRRGALKVRESLEEQTMNMALSATKLFEENLRYSNGEPCRRSSSPTPRSAASTRRPPAPTKFRARASAITLTVTPCWCYGSETMDMDPAIPSRAYGASTAPSAPAPCTWPPCWQATPRRACRPSASTATTCRTPTTPPSPRTCATRSSLRTRRLAVAHDARQVLPADRLRLHGHRRLRSSTPTSSRTTSACASSPSTRSRSSAA